MFTACGQYLSKLEYSIRGRSRGLFGIRHHLEASTPSICAPMSSVYRYKPILRRLAPVLPLPDCARFLFTQIEVDASAPSFNLEALKSEVSDGDLHGYCNVVFVGFEPDNDQYMYLKEYSQKFKV